MQDKNHTVSQKTSLTEFFNVALDVTKSKLFFSDNLLA